MINCPRENSQASGPMTNRAGCKHICRPASDFFFCIYIIWPCILMLILITGFLAYCLFVARVVSFAPECIVLLKSFRLMFPFKSIMIKQKLARDTRNYRLAQIKSYAFLRNLHPKITQKSDNFLRFLFHLLFILQVLPFSIAYF
jgi:hypothetical protein